MNISNTDYRDLVAKRSLTKGDGEPRRRSMEKTPTQRPQLDRATSRSLVISKSDYDDLKISLAKGDENQRARSMTKPVQSNSLQRSNTKKGTQDAVSNSKDTQADNWGKLRNSLTQEGRPNKFSAEAMEKRRIRRLSQSMTVPKSEMESLRNEFVSDAKDGKDPPAENGNGGRHAKKGSAGSRSLHKSDTTPRKRNSVRSDSGDVLNRSDRDGKDDTKQTAARRQSGRSKANGEGNSLRKSSIKGSSDDMQRLVREARKQAGDTSKPLRKSVRPKTNSNGASLRRSSAKGSSDDMQRLVREARKQAGDTGRPLSKSTTAVGMKSKESASLRKSRISGSSGDMEKLLKEAKQAGDTSRSSSRGKPGMKDDVSLRRSVGQDSTNNPVSSRYEYKPRRKHDDQKGALRQSTRGKDGSTGLRQSVRRANDGAADSRRRGSASDARRRSSGDLSAGSAELRQSRKRSDSITSNPGDLRRSSRRSGSITNGAGDLRQSRRRSGSITKGAGDLRQSRRHSDEDQAGLRQSRRRSDSNNYGQTDLRQSRRRSGIV